MPNPPDSKADCYSANERGAMVWTQRLRERWCEPLLAILARAGVRPDHLTWLSLLSGLAFCPLYLSSQYWWSKPAAFMLLALHVIWDGLDGPLARRIGVASRGGSFTDSTSDQIVVAATTISLMVAEPRPIDVVPGGIYIFVYTMVVAFAMVRNAMGIPYSWLIRPRFCVYAWLFVETYWLPGTLNVMLWLCNALLVWKMVTGFRAIRKVL